MTSEEFGQIVMAHKDRVHTYAIWMLRNGDDAREVAQESLTRLWQHRGDVRNGSAKAWLLRTTHRLCIDRIRRKNTATTVGLDDLAGPPAAGEPGPVRQMERQELRAKVMAALAALSPRDRAVMLMREYNDMSYEEIADALGMSLAALKTTIHRARGRLRHALNGAGVHSS